MLVGPVALRRVAIVGGVRIPFARSYSLYATATNQDLLTAAFRGLVERFKLQGERLGDVAAGAVMKHPKDYNLVRECVLSSGLDPHTPGLDMQRACGTSLEAAIDIGSKIALGQIDAGIAGGTDSHQRCAHGVPARLPAAAARELPRTRRVAAPLTMVRAAAQALQTGPARSGRAAHRALDGTERGDHGAGVADHARRAGPARLRQSREGRRRLAGGLLR
jgi:acetyl-CoA acetyltransferase